MEDNVVTDNSEALQNALRRIAQLEANQRDIMEFAYHFCLHWVATGKDMADLDGSVIFDAWIGSISTQQPEGPDDER